MLFDSVLGLSYFAPYPRENDELLSLLSRLTRFLLQEVRECRHQDQWSSYVTRLFVPWVFKAEKYSWWRGRTWQHFSYSLGLCHAPGSALHMILYQAFEQGIKLCWSTWAIGPGSVWKIVLYLIMAKEFASKLISKIKHSMQVYVLEGERDFFDVSLLSWPTSVLSKLHSNAIHVN